MAPMKRASVLISTLIACGAAGLTSVPAWSADGGVVVGLAVAQSGFMTAYDGDATKSVKLWVDQQNAAGGLLGKPIKLVESDTKSDRAQGAKAGQEVLSEGANLVVVSCDYDFGAPAASAAQRAKTVSMFLCAEDPKAGVQGVGSYSFTASAAAQVQGATSAGWAQKALGAKTGYVLLDNSIEYSKSVCAGWDWEAERIGLKTLGSDTFKNDDPSVQSQITRIKALPEKPDVLMLCSYNPGAASAIRQIRAAGLTMPIFAGSSSDGTYWTNAVPGLSDFYVPVQASVYGDDPHKEVNDYVESFKAKFGAPPASQYALPAYAFMQLWGRAVEKAGTTDAAKVVPVMEQYKDEASFMGPRTFTSKFHIQTNVPMQIIKYTDGKPKDVDQFRVTEEMPVKVLFRAK
jgi:branched-chain amino acid transport system substrate-binding protein